MSSKLASYTALLLILLLDIAYFVSVNKSSKLINTGSESIGPAYFPNLLAVILVVLCLIGLLQTARKEDTKIHIPHFKMIGFTVALMVLFILSWSAFGWFYLQNILFLTILLTVYRYKPGKILYITFTSLLLSMIATAFIYAVFNLVMHSTL